MPTKKTNLKIKNLNILLGVSGGIAAYKVVDLASKLTAAGANSPLFKGFAPTIHFADEHYWNLTGETSSITTMMTASGGPTGPSSGPPTASDLDGNDWPVIWTKTRGPGRVFACVLGHNYFTFNDPYFRIILLRAMAWTMNESFDPFKPLVTANLER